MDPEKTVRYIFGEGPYARLVESIRDFVIFFTDPHGLVVSWNEGARLIFGYEEAEIVGQSAFILFTPEDREQRIPELELQKAAAEGRAEDVRWHVCKDGTRFWANGVTTGIYADDGSLQGFAKVARDDTQRKLAEEEREHLIRSLESERAKLAAIFAKAPAFVAALRGPEHVFELVNPAYLQLVGHRDLIGKSVHEALPEIEGQGFIEVLDRVRQTGEPYEGREIRIMLQREPGRPLEERFADLLYHPLKEPDGSVSGIFAHGIDITEQVHARQEAEETNRVKDEFLATLSHELRTPLTSILGWARMLRSGQLADDEFEMGLETIERNAQAQSQLIEDILDVSRVITGNLRLDIQAVDLTSIIEEAVNTVLPAAEAKDIQLQRVLDSGAGSVLGDRARLQQVVWNLLSNAMKFTPRGGRVQIRLERVESHVEIVVSDNGQGISAEVLAHIFERFRQADATSTRAHGGLGLGLAIVRHLVELHGGTVEARSEGLGCGATFCVRLPLTAVIGREIFEPGRAPTEQTLERGTPFDCPAELTGLHVLVVDDEADSRILLKMVLEKCGARVTAVASAAEAWSSFMELPPDVLVSDIGMPVEDGFSLIARVRQLPAERGGQTPALALTAYARAQDRAKALKAGFNVHLAKPVEPVELINMVTNVAQRSEEK